MEHLHETTQKQETSPNDHNPILSATVSNQGPQGESELTLKDIIDLVSHAGLIIRAKWYWGALAAALILAGLGYVAATKPLEGKAQTVIVAQSTLDKIINREPGNSNEVIRENDLRNHLSVMESRKFRSKFLTDLNQEELDSILKPYKRPGLEMDNAWQHEFLENHITIERERGREMYTITVTHLDPDAAVLLADRFASVYIKFVQAEYKTASQQGYAILENQTKTLSEEIATIEEKKLEYRRLNKIISQTDNQGILTERLKRIDASLTDIRIRCLQLKTQLAQCKRDKAATQYPWDNSYLATFANNAQLRQELDRAMTARAALAARYGTSHPKMRDVDASIEGIRLNILRNFDIAIGDLETQLEQAIESQTQLQREFDQSFDSSLEVEKLASRLQVMDSAAEGKRETLTQLQKKIGEAAISNELPADLMQVVDPGFLVKPRIPKRLLLLALVGMMALGGFVVTPLAVDLFDARVKGTSDLESTLGLHLLGAIPTLKGSREERALMVRNQIDLVTTECFIGITGSMDISTGRKSSRVIMLTSTLPEEGKSLVASNLASAYRQLKKSVAIIDLDLRRPTQHTLHSVKNTSGFLTWMDKGGEVHVENLPDGIGFVPAGGHDTQPSHHFVSPKMAAFLEQLKRRFDIILVDTPPAGVFQDARVLARFAEDRILVVRDSRAPVMQVRKVIEDFARAQTPFSGMVLNGFNPKTASKKLAYGYKASTEGYSYNHSKA